MKFSYLVSKTRHLSKTVDISTVSFLIEKLTSPKKATETHGNTELPVEKVVVVKKRTDEEQEIDSKTELGVGEGQAPVTEEKALLVVEEHLEITTTKEKVAVNKKTHFAQKRFRKTIEINTRRELWKRSGGKCEYISDDGKRCRSTHALEIDHLKSHALGGTVSIENLAYHCKIHNQLNAIQTFSFMKNYLSKIR